MAFTKYCSFESAEIIELKGSEVKKKTASLDKTSDYDSYRTGDGYLYARIRAISSRVNRNHDGWPSVELAGGEENWHKHASRHQAGTGFTIEASKDDEYGFSTFIGKPIFVDHHNSDPSRARGVIVDSKLHVQDHKTASELDPYYASSDADPAHLPPTHVELLLEVDAKSFPKLAKAIVEGGKDGSKGIDGFSMGCDVDYSTCSHCGNKASSPQEYCSHVKAKGAEHDFVTSSGTKTSRKSYENCHGIKFFEISAVFDPADETALTQEIIDEEPSKKEGSFLSRRQASTRPGSFLSNRKVADNPLPQDELTKAPEDVDTLREEKVCAVCGSDMENGKCDVCGYEEPPEQMKNPDLSKAKDADDQKRDQDQTTIPADENVPPAADGQGTSYLQARNPRPTASVKDDMRWTPTEITAASGGGDEPDEVVINDQTAPVTSAFRTAQQLMKAAKRNPGDTMSNKVAAEPADASGKADKRVNVDEIGGVDQASNENASKADAQVDVEGKGGVGVTDVSADSHETLDTAGRDSDDSGFNKDKTTQDSGPTKTFPNKNQTSPVTNKPFPSSEEGVKKSHDDAAFPKDDEGLAGGSAVKGTQPADPVGKAQDRVSPLDHVTSPANNSGPTKTWTGTDGNGVTKQAPPVTRDTHEFNTEKASSAHIFAAFKQAETEVELGITPKADKYNRAQELTNLSPNELKAVASVTSKVAKTASTRTATTRQATRVPSFKRIASDEATPTTEVPDDEAFAAGLFGR